MRGGRESCGDTQITEQELCTHPDIKIPAGSRACSVDVMMWTYDENKLLAPKIQEE